MKNDETTIREARDAQTLEIVSDGNVAANIAKYVMTLELLLCGRPAHRKRDGEPMVIGGLQFSQSERMTVMGIASVMRTDHVCLAFDRENAAGAPVAVDVIRCAGEMIETYPSCGLWAPAQGGRLLVIARHKNASTHHFAFRAGEGLARREGLPSGFDDAGFRRAGFRLERMAKSDAVDAVHGRFRTTVFQGIGPGAFSATTERLAA